MNDDTATVHTGKQAIHAAPVRSYCVGETVMLDGSARLPVVACMESDEVHTAPLSPMRLAFTVSSSDSATCVPSRTPRHALNVPPHLAVRDALLLPGCWPKVWVGLTCRLNVRAHEAVLIHHAHTTAGMLATILALEIGADVLAVCDSAEAARRLIALGASEAATYASCWPELMREHGGADVVLDLAGGRYTGMSTLCARRHARIGVMDAAGHGLFDETQWQRFIARQLALIVADWSPLREAACASEAALAFDAITRTSGWARFTRARPDSPFESHCDH
ncbi:Zinc-binding dehydrogenase [Paraburkholderia susongensis]|uniref:Zinc-binding dehydrogenase n=2 Tax=Paraburkholderia susongensis TaxID=1515439 RepID=A0A1X7JFK6_9BURK|nr:Zinc-binding dehydrogenase [Paraburkholderia susongensis]